MDLFLLLLLVLLLGLYTVILYHFFKSVLYHLFILNRLTDKKKNRLEHHAEIKLMVRKGKKQQRNGFLFYLDKYLKNLPLSRNTSVLKLTFAFCLIIGLAVFILTQSLLFTIGATLAVPLAVGLILSFLQKKRLNRLRTQLTDAVLFISSNLKAGYSLMQALNMIADEGIQPLAGELAFILQEINIGVPYEEAFQNFLERNPLEEIEVFVNAILISKETGGNLTNILGTVIDSLREKERLKGEINSLTAQGRLSGLVLILLPLLVFLGMLILNPTYMAPLLHTSLGNLLLGIAFCTQVIGILLINKITKIEW